MSICLCLSIYVYLSTSLSISVYVYLLSRLPQGRGLKSQCIQILHAGWKSTFVDKNGCLYLSVHFIVRVFICNSISRGGDRKGFILSSPVQNFGLLQCPIVMWENNDKLHVTIEVSLLFFAWLKRNLDECLQVTLVCFALLPIGSVWPFWVCFGSVFLSKRSVFIPTWAHRGR